MPTWAFQDAGIYVDSFDFTGVSNQGQLSCEATQLDRSNFRSGGWSESIMGAKTSTLTVAGQADMAQGSTDDWQFANLGATGKVVTIATREIEGDVTYMVQSMPTNFQHGGEWNTVAPFSLNGVCSDAQGVIRGTLLCEMTSVTATGAIGTAAELGSVSASQYVYSTIHLFGTAGSSITVLVESDEDDQFGSATTRITHGSHTTVGGRWGTRAAGSITDTWWRARVSAISGTWVVAVAAGIQ